MKKQPGKKPISIPTTKRVLALIKERSPINTNDLAKAFRRGRKSPRGQDSVMHKLRPCLHELADEGVVMPTLVREDEERIYWNSV